MAELPSPREPQPRVRFHVDRSAFDVVGLIEEGDERTFWASRSVEERIAAVEAQRQVVYGYDAVPSRLRRVLEIARLERG